MMAGKFLCIALFATLQISFVLCRSTGSQDELVTEIVIPTGEAMKAEALKQTVAPGAMDYDIYVTIPDDAFIKMREATLGAAAVVGIIFGVIAIVSIIIGCIVFLVLRKRKQPRPGHVVSFNNVG